MRLARLLTVLTAVAATTVVLAAPASASDAQSAYIYPPSDPLAPLRYMTRDGVELNELVTIGAVAVDLETVERAKYALSHIAAPSYSVRYVLDNTLNVSGYCTYARSGAGVESGYGDVTFTVGGEATAVGRYRGTEVVATGVKCDLYKPDAIVTTGSQFAPGSAVAAATSYTSYDARGGMICTTVYALFREAPTGESSALKTFPTSCR